MGFFGIRGFYEYMRKHLWKIFHLEQPTRMIDSHRDSLPSFTFASIFYFCYILFKFISGACYKKYIFSLTHLCFFFPPFWKHENKTILSRGLVAKPFGGLYHRFGRGLVHSLDLLEYYRAAWTGELSVGLFFYLFVCFVSAWLVFWVLVLAVLMGCVTPRRSLSSLERWLSHVQSQYSSDPYTTASPRYHDP